MKRYAQNHVINDDSDPVLATCLIRQVFLGFRQVFRWPMSPLIYRYAHEHLVSEIRLIHKQPNTFCLLFLVID